jgi:hypothetical protein
MLLIEYRLNILKLKKKLSSNPVGRNIVLYMQTVEIRTPIISFIRFKGEISN